MNRAILLPLASLVMHLFYWVAIVPILALAAPALAVRYVGA
jgi:hypothetical protein